MKIPLVFALAAAGLAGCGQKSDVSAQNTNSSSSGGVLTAPVDYLGAVAKGKQNAERTIGKVDAASVNQAISMFAAENGRNPNNLQELVPKYIPKLPEPPVGYELSYDAGSGTVKLVPKATAVQK